MGNIVEGLQHDDADRALRREHEDSTSPDEQKNREIDRGHYENIAQQAMPEKAFSGYAEAGLLDAPGIQQLARDGTNQKAIDVFAQSRRSRILFGRSRTMM